MRIIISGGGTGGHIYPAITIARAIQRLQPSVQILFVGTRSGLEADIIPKEGFLFKTLEVHGFERRLSLKNIGNLFTTAASLWQAKKLINEFKPDIVIGTGGYVCGPILLVASLMGVPTMIQEQNVIPGITNKILSRFVDKIAVGYGEAATHFKATDKVIVTGNPIRQEVLSADREEALAALNLAADKLTILISGGSRGARAINNAMLEVYKNFAGKQDIQFLHVTGQSEYNNIVGKVKQIGIDTDNIGNITIKPYLYNMPQALAVADLAIFRAGAIGLAELTARGVASILIPYPYAAENHQEYNAQVMEKDGAAIVLHDHELDTTLSDAIVKLINSPDKLKRMALASKQLGKPNAADDIATIAVEDIYKK